METLADISSNDVCASVRIRMPVQLRASQLVEEKFFLPFINGIYDNIEVPGILKASVTVWHSHCLIPIPMIAWMRQVWHKLWKGSSK